MACLRNADPEAPSHLDPDLFSHHAKRGHAAMVPAAKEIFQKNFASSSHDGTTMASWQKARLAGSVNYL
jgi:hypothetical protein